MTPLKRIQFGDILGSVKGQKNKLFVVKVKPGSKDGSNYTNVLIFHYFR